MEVDKYEYDHNFISSWTKKFVIDRKRKAFKETQIESDHEITVTRSTKSVLSEPEQRLMAMINGKLPRNEHERIMQAQVEEMMKKGVIIDIPEV